MTNGSLPRAGTLAGWLEAALAGRVAPDDFEVAVRGSDPQHLVVGLPGSPSVPLLELVGRLARLGVSRVSLALPVPGDPVGLAGPAPFNTAAIEAGSAVLAGSFGLVPSVDARTVVWQVHPAEPPASIDPIEAFRTLRQTLLEVTDRLVRLDVAAWQPEIPDLLLNLQHREPLPLPPGYGGPRLEAIDRAVLCLDIGRLALASEGGALSSYEITRRRAALTDLDRAARRALVAAIG